MIKMKFFAKKIFQRVLQEKVLLSFSLQEKFPTRAKKRPRLVKNCHGPRKSQFFATLVPIPHFHPKNLHP